jgi:hypothetical protein
MALEFVNLYIVIVEWVSLPPLIFKPASKILASHDRSVDGGGEGSHRVVLGMKRESTAPLGRAMCRSRLTLETEENLSAWTLW